MPSDINSRAVSAITGFLLFLTVIQVCYTNGVYEGAFGSLPICAVAALVSVAAFVKLGSAVGMSNAVFNGIDAVLSVVPVLSIAILGWRSLSYYKDGLAGFMAALAISTLTGMIIFGVTDTVGAWFGKKYHDIQAVAAEAQRRAAAAADALSH